MTKLVAIEGHGWAIEGSFEIVKNKFGLDRNKIRRPRPSRNIADGCARSKKL